MSRIEPFFPLFHGCYGWMTRRVISGIIFVLRHGLRWREAPCEYGPHQTIYNRFIRWSWMGMFNKIFAALSTKGGLNSELHAACDEQGQPLLMLLTEGQMSDFKGAKPMLDGLLA